MRNSDWLFTINQQKGGSEKAKQSAKPRTPSERAIKTSKTVPQNVGCILIDYYRVL